MTESDKEKEIIHVGWKGTVAARKMVQDLDALGASEGQITEAIDRLLQEAEIEAKLLLTRRMAPSE